MSFGGDAGWGPRLRVVISSFRPMRRGGKIMWHSLYLGGLEAVTLVIFCCCCFLVVALTYPRLSL